MNLRAFFGLGSSPALPVLVEEDVALHFPVMADFDAWSSILDRDEEVLGQFQPTIPRAQRTKPAYRRRLSLYRRQAEKGSGLAFHMKHAASGAFMGAIRLAPISRGAAQAGTLGYWVAADHQCRGIATCAVRAIVRFAFEDLGLSRLEAHCVPENHASKRVLEKNSFHGEGISRGYLSLHGTPRDHLRYSVLATDSR